jgi:hypothetical protein
VQALLDAPFSGSLASHLETHWDLLCGDDADVLIMTRVRRAQQLGHDRVALEMLERRDVLAEARRAGRTVAANTMRLVIGRRVSDAVIVLVAAQELDVDATAIIARYPLLRTDGALRHLERLAETTGDLRFSRARATLLELRAGSGPVHAAFPEPVPVPSDFEAVEKRLIHERRLRQLWNASSVSEQKLIVRSHWYALMSLHSEDYLGALSDRALRDDEGDVVRFVNAMWQLLCRCRVDGVEAAFDDSPR